MTISEFGLHFQSESTDTKKGQIHSGKMAHWDMHKKIPNQVRKLICNVVPIKKKSLIRLISLF